MAQIIPGTRWRGSSLLEHGKEVWSFTSTKVSVTTSWTGSYVDCQANRPLVGQILPAYPLLWCSQVNVDEMDAGAGRIGVILEAQLDTSNLTFAPLGPPIFELEFQEFSRPLEQHSRCGVLKEDRDVNPAVMKKVSWDDWYVFRPQDYDSTGSGSGIWAGTAKWSLATYKALKEKGQDSYVLKAPIFRRTTVHFRPPSDVGAMSGRLQFPPNSGQFDISDWDWLAGPDRLTSEDKGFRRMSEWIAADYWDRDSYSS